MMMTDKLNSGLIESMKEKIPEGANLANLLMDILYIGCGAKCPLRLPKPR